MTQPFSVDVCLGSTCYPKVITLPVRAGGATELFVDCADQSSTTPVTVTVTVDSSNNITELREDNNSTSLPDVSLNF